MNVRNILLLTAATGAQALCAAPAKKAPAKEAPRRPNIIYILADDLGYGDVGILGQKTIPTPNIDRMARQGMIFTNHHAGAPVSSPSRCSLMTGKHTGHTTIRGNSGAISQMPALSPSDVTIPEAIKNGTNYTTGMTGRWHLGEENSHETPYERGFDYHFGKLGGGFRNLHGVMIDSLWDKDGKHIPFDQYSKLGLEAMFENGHYYNLSPEDMANRPINMDRLVTDKAKAFIERKAAGEQPFFLYVAYSLVHAPLEYHEATPVEPNDWPPVERAFASMVMSLDKYVGEILDCVDRMGIAQNTMVIFSSDNGPHSEGGHSYQFFDSNGQLRGFKRDLYEGGTRIPMIVRWSGTIKPGSTTDLLSAFWDVQATCCELAGAPIPAGTDGISFVPTLLGREQKQKHEYLYWEYNERSARPGGPEYKQAVAFGPWKVIKYIDRDTIEVYNLGEDLGEHSDLLAQRPEIVKKALEYMQQSHVSNPNFPMLKEERTNMKNKNQKNTNQ